MATKYCTHFACRFAHDKLEGAARAAKQRERHNGKAPCKLATIQADPKTELNRLYGKFATIGE